MNYNPKFLILILNWNGYEYTKACIESIFNNSYKNFEIVVVDNNSEHGDAKKLYNDFNNKITIIQNTENYGFAEGNNIGIRSVLNKEFDFLFLLNNDTLTNPDTLKQLAEHIQQNPKSEIIVPKMLKLDNPTQIDNLGMVLTLTGIPFNRLSKKRNLFFPTGGAAIFSKKLLLNLWSTSGFFDPDFFAYAEDYDLGLRCLRINAKLSYANNVLILHKGSASTSPMSPFATFQTYRNIIWSIYKNYPFAALLYVLPSLHIMYLLLFVKYLFSDRKKATALLQGFFAAYKDLPLILKKRHSLQKMGKLSTRKLLKKSQKVFILSEYLKF